MGEVRAGDRNLGVDGMKNGSFRSLKSRPTREYRLGREVQELSTEVLLCLRVGEQGNRKGNKEGTDRNTRGKMEESGLCKPKERRRSHPLCQTLPRGPREN